MKTNLESMEDTGYKALQQLEALSLDLGLDNAASNKHNTAARSHPVDVDVTLASEDEFQEQWVGVQPSDVRAWLAELLWPCSYTPGEVTSSLKASSGI